MKTKKKAKTLTEMVGCALRRAGRSARKTALAHGTPVYIWQNGKIVAQKP